MNLANRRKFHRIDFDGNVNLQFTNDSYDCCQIKNLSLTGMFVKGDFQKQRVKKCDIKLFHKEKSGDNCLQASGKVVWINDEGVGLRFTKMTFENYILLQTTLRNNAEQPAIILREFPKEFPFKISSS